MKISYLQVQSPQFAKALSKLATHGGFTDYKQLANIKTFLKQFEKLTTVAQKEWIELLKGFCQLDEKGEFIPQDGKPGTFVVTPGKEAEFHAISAEFNTRAADIWADPIPFEQCKTVGFSAADLVQLEGIILDSTDELGLKTAIA